MTPLETCKKLIDRDYQIVFVFPETGEVRKKSLDIETSLEPVMDFDDIMSSELLSLIGEFTVYGFQYCEIYWCYEISRYEYGGGRKYESLRELCDLYRWWMNNKY